MQLILSIFLAPFSPRCVRTLGKMHCKTLQVFFASFQCLPTRSSSPLNFYAWNSHFQLWPWLRKVFKHKLHMRRTTDILSYLTECRPKELKGRFLWECILVFFSFLMLYYWSHCCIASSIAYGYLGHYNVYLVCLVKHWSLVMETQL